VTIAGNIYGVVLNDAEEHQRLAPQFGEKPYGAAPIAPVIYMKPLASVVHGKVPVPADTGLAASTTLAVLIARDTGGVTRSGVADCLGGVALALDLSVPASSYYRPAVAQKNGEGRLALGDFVAPAMPEAITLFADGKPVHEWSLERLVRPLDLLVADLGAFLTLKAGDVLLIGLPGDAPVIRPGQTLRVVADGLPEVEIATSGEYA
jgi:5-oxopent-3-ene-1,2,5-tricarboxylate decarboxylase / 2-hydroxyhepta-2,4-diene-1,7-dioate isomerase